METQKNAKQIKLEELGKQFRKVQDELDAIQKEYDKISLELSKSEEATK
jgi:ABC-type phosphate transport system auxiliary subunit